MIGYFKNLATSWMKHAERQSELSKDFYKRMNHHLKTKQEIFKYIKEPTEKSSFFKATSSLQKCLHLNNEIFKDICTYNYKKASLYPQALTDYVDIKRNNYKACLQEQEAKAGFLFPPQTLFKKMALASLALWSMNAGFTEAPSFEDIGGSLTYAASQRKESFNEIDSLKSPIASSTLQTLGQEMFNKTVKLAGFSLDDVKNFAMLAESSYSYADHDTLRAIMESKGYKTTAFHKNSNVTQLDMPSGRQSGFLFLKGEEVIVVYRGTEQSSLADLISDVATDINATMVNNPHGPGQIHKGFYNEFRRSDEFLLQLIYDHCKANHLKINDLKISVTGHSLGGALATLFVDTAISRWGVPAENVSLVTFASPRVGDKTFAQSFNALMKERTLRVNLKDQDVVTGVGLKAMGYEHVGQPLDLCLSTSLSHPLEAHYMGTYANTLAMLETQNFKARSEIVMDISSSSYNLRTIPPKITNNLIGVIFKAANYLDPTAYGWLAFGSSATYKENLPENKIGQREVAKLLELFMKEFTILNQKMDLSTAHNSKLGLLEKEKYEALFSMGQILHTLEKDKIMGGSLTQQQREIFQKLKPLYQHFEEASVQTDIQLAKVKQAVEQVKHTLNEYALLKASYSQQKVNLTAVQDNMLKKELQMLYKKARAQRATFVKERQQLKKQVQNFYKTTKNMTDFIKKWVGK